MTRVVRNAALFCVAGILVVSAALASVPDPSTSSYHTEGGCPPGINCADYIALAGTLSGVPDNCADGNCNDYTLIVRDFSGAPVSGATVVIDFSNCPDLQLACTQTARAPYVATNIGGKKVQSTTDAAGKVILTPDGAATDVLTPPASIPTPVGTAFGTACAQLYANGVPMRALRVSAFDINSLPAGQGGTSAVDAGYVASLAAKAGVFPGQTYERADVNWDGVVSSKDASREGAMGAQGPLSGTNVTAPYCP